jgi:hypothetical protein
VFWRFFWRKFHFHHISFVKRFQLRNKWFFDFWWTSWNLCFRKYWPW